MGERRKFERANAKSTVGLGGGPRNLKKRDDYRKKRDAKNRTAQKMRAQNRRRG